MTQRIAFLGLGTMGLPMSHNLKKKFDLKVWNRGSPRAQQAALEGLVVAKSPSEAVLGADVICTCVSTPQALLEVVAAIKPGLQKGQLLIDFSTVSVSTIEQLAAELQPIGVGVIDAPVTGSRGGAEKGTLVVMAGGAKSDLERAKPVFDAVGEKVIHCGPLGAGTQVKLAGNGLIAAMLQAFSEGLLLTSRAGVDPQKFIEVVQASGFRSPYFEFKGKSLLAHEFTPHFTVDLMHKDLTLLNENASALGVPMPTAASLKETYQLARSAGLGHLDISAVITVFEKLMGTSIGFHQ
jgi:3-hydroxyisobutyrate dehydrogenase